jgi:YVTN family beta-propeller protein
LRNTSIEPVRLSRITWFGCSLVLVFCVSGARAVDAAPFAYVANTNDNTVSVIDVATNNVFGTPIAVGEFPVEVVVNAAGTRAYIANAYGSSVSVIDTATHTVVATVPNLTSVSGLALSPDGTRLYVAAHYFVHAIDTATNAEIGQPIALVAANAGGCLATNGHIALDASGMLLYVPTADCRGYLESTGILAVIDVRAGIAIANVEVGQYPTSATLDAAGQRVYVTNWWSGDISVVDTASHAVSTITLGSTIYPINAVLDPSGARLYVANNGARTVTVIDTLTNTVDGTSIAVGVEPCGIAITTDGAHIYTANQYDSVSVIDTATRAVQEISAGIGRNPTAIALTRGDKLFASGFE